MIELHFFISVFTMQMHHSRPVSPEPLTIQLDCPSCGFTRICTRSIENCRKCGTKIRTPGLPPAGGPRAPPPTPIVDPPAFVPGAVPVERSRKKRKRSRKLRQVDEDAPVLSAGVLPGMIGPFPPPQEEDESDEDDIDRLSRLAMRKGAVFGAWVDVACSFL